ncbi:hypothetical protein ACJX0J_016655, partial [Zea mays]
MQEIAGAEHSYNGFVGVYINGINGRTATPLFSWEQAKETRRLAFTSSPKVCKKGELAKEYSFFFPAFLDIFLRGVFHLLILLGGFILTANKFHGFSKYIDLTCTFPMSPNMIAPLPLEQPTEKQL